VEMVDKTGAEELVRLKKGFASGCGCRLLLGSGEYIDEDLGESSVTGSKDNGGKVGAELSDLEWLDE
jgi:hypothetical protein